MDQKTGVLSGVKEDDDRAGPGLVGHNKESRHSSFSVACPWLCRLGAGEIERPVPGT